MPETINNMTDTADDSYMTETADGSDKSDTADGSDTSDTADGSDTSDNSAENSYVPETIVEDIHASSILFDWRNKGVTNGRLSLDQSKCSGMDWAIVAAAAMEASY